MTSLRQRVLQRAIPLVGAAALTITTLTVTTLTLAPAAHAADPASVSGEPCSPGEGVTVVVDLIKAGASGAPLDEVRLGCAPGPQASGLTALAAAGFDVNDDSGPGTVCQIDGLPASGFPSCWNDGYWSYWRSDGTEAWDFSDVGAGGTGTVPVDSVEGWSYALGSEGWSSAPPRVAVADLPGFLDVGPFTDQPHAPVISTIAASETLSFTRPQGSSLEIAAIDAGDDLASADWSAGDELTLAAYEGQDIRVLARVVGTTAPSFDATYRVRATYSPGRDLGTQDNPDVSVPGNDPGIKGWATGVADYVAGTNVNVGFQTPERALGPVGSDLVVLGDRGTITLTFDTPIGDGDGADLAVYENGFRVGSGNLDFLELGRVAVSSNGTDFATFDSAAQRTTPVGSFVGMEAAQVGGLAGRDLSGRGTPFDLAALSNDPLVRSGAVDLMDITHVKVIDVVGDGSELDSFGRPIYDPYPLTGSAGFDLTGIAVLNEAPPTPEPPVVEPPVVEPVPAPPVQPTPPAIVPPTETATLAKAFPDVRVRAVGKTSRGVRRGRVAAFRVVVTAEGLTPTGRVRIKVAGKRRVVTLNAKGRAAVRIRIARKSTVGKKRVRVVYLGDDHVARGKVRMTLRVRR